MIYWIKIANLGIKILIREWKKALLALQTDHPIRDPIYLKKEGRETIRVMSFILC